MKKATGLKSLDKFSQPGILLLRKNRIWSYGEKDYLLLFFR